MGGGQAEEPGETVHGLDLIEELLHRPLVDLAVGVAGCRGVGLRGVGVEPGGVGRAALAVDRSGEKPEGEAGSQAMENPAYEGMTLSHRFSLLSSFERPRAVRSRCCQESEEKRRLSQGNFEMDSAPVAVDGEGGPVIGVAALGIGPQLEL